MAITKVFLQHCMNMKTSLSLCQFGLMAAQDIKISPIQRGLFHHIKVWDEKSERGRMNHDITLEKSEGRTGLNILSGLSALVLYEITLCNE